MANSTELRVGVEAEVNANHAEEDDKTFCRCMSYGEAASVFPEEFQV